MYLFFTLVSSNATAMWLFLDRPNCLPPSKTAGSVSAAQESCKTHSKETLHTGTCLSRKLPVCSGLKLFPLV